MATGVGGVGAAGVADFDQLVDEVLAKKGPATYKDGLSEDNWEEELEQIPLFMTRQPSEINPESAPALAALQDLIYKEDTPHSRALAHKEDGNEHFKRRSYKRATEAYSKGLSEELTESWRDKQLQSVLYCNRSAAHFHLGNFRSALGDADRAHKIDPKHMKAIARGAECCMKLKRFDEAVKWCDIGLKIEKDHSVLKSMRPKAIIENKKKGRDQRRELAAMKTKSQNEMDLIQTIKSRGVTLVDSGGEVDLRCPHPDGGRVQLAPDGVLVWPVVLLYPEYGQTDLIREFPENDSFIRHIGEVFREPAPWDLENKYTLQTIRLYYHDTYTEGVFRVDMQDTLGSVLRNKRYVVSNGTPLFTVVSTLSAHMNHFLRDKK